MCVTSRGISRLIVTSDMFPDKSFSAMRRANEFEILILAIHVISTVNFE